MILVGHVLALMDMIEGSPLEFTCSFVVSPLGIYEDPDKKDAINDRSLFHFYLEFTSYLHFFSSSVVRHLHI
jgi:hypothetical protein